MSGGELGAKRIMVRVSSLQMIRHLLVTGDVEDAVEMLDRVLAWERRDELREARSRAWRRLRELDRESDPTPGLRELLYEFVRRCDAELEELRV